MSARWQDRQPHTLLLPETINSVTHGPVPFKRNPETSEEAPKPWAKREGNAMAVIHLGPTPWLSLVRLKKVLSCWRLPQERKGSPRHTARMPTSRGGARLVSVCSL